MEEYKIKPVININGLLENKVVFQDSKTPDIGQAVTSGIGNYVDTIAINCILLSKKDLDDLVNVLLSHRPCFGLSAHVERKE